MPEIYLIIVVLLFILAVSDLIVGVSNDAVNFLNSAVGSKVAPRKIIMIVATLGILVGATFSSGMMEVARKGIFNPEMFYFSEIMVIFLAVMLTDIILLDLFNTFGLPTSTTVSIVFELLGAAVVVAMIKLFTTDDISLGLADYINSSNAILIISGIFLSVGIAFTIGSMVQYVSRLLFTFHFQKRLKAIGHIWSGLALTALTYFLLIKGVSGTSFGSQQFISWVGTNTTVILLGFFVFWTVLMGCLLWFRVEVLRFVVLFGTFSLAMAFAGNDLVNFIGVPIAGLQSYLIWTESGIPADLYTMEVLGQTFRTQTSLLIGAGVIMATTLWLSKKARSVTETEVDLGRQNEGLERFTPNLLSQVIVRRSRNLVGSIQQVVPNSWIEKAEQQFQESPKLDQHEVPPPAFDLVRASVNLTIASVLIALATSYKMPMSTTYVSFMVAMGTSLADRAWGRDSAVFRVAGVLNVIGGWFMTAIIAFTVAGLFAFLLLSFQLAAIIVLLCFAGFILIKTHFIFSKNEKRKARKREIDLDRKRFSSAQIIEHTIIRVNRTIALVPEIITRSIQGLHDEDLNQINHAFKRVDELISENDELKFQMISSISRIDEDFNEGSRIYLLVFDLEQDLIQSCQFIVNAVREHIRNSLPIPEEHQVQEFIQLAGQLNEYCTLIQTMLANQNFNNYEKVSEMKNQLFTNLEILLGKHIQNLKERNASSKTSFLLFSVLLELKDIIAVCSRFVKLYQRLEQFPNQNPRLIGKHFT